MIPSNSAHSVNIWVFLVAFGYFLITSALQFLLRDVFYQCTILPKASQVFKLLFVPGCGSWLICVGVSLGRLLRGGQTSAKVEERSVCALQGLLNIEQVLTAGLFFQDEWKAPSYFYFKVEVRRDFPCVNLFADHSLKTISFNPMFKYLMTKTV